MTTLLIHEEILDEQDRKLRERAIDLIARYIETGRPVRPEHARMRYGYLWDYNSGWPYKAGYRSIYILNLYLRQAEARSRSFSSRLCGCSVSDVRRIAVPTELLPPCGQFPSVSEETFELLTMLASITTN